MVVGGYGFAFGEDFNKIIGVSHFAGNGFDNSNHYRDWLFQWAFVGTAYNS